MGKQNLSVVKTAGDVVSDAAAAPATAEFHPVIIIGAGFSGINAAIRLKQAGHHDFIVLERADDVGGTWRDNIYPGCACDVPSVLYSYSFEQNPDWSSAYSGSDEIKNYISHCVDKYGIRSHLRFKVDITGAEFDEKTGAWTLRADNGKTFQARAVVSAVGGLVNPSWPNIAGRDTFKGKVMHTARWDRSYDIKGKRVAVIGTGASAIQVIPAIQPQVAAMTVFQRTPPWIIPKNDINVSDGARKLFRRLPLAQRFIRNSIFTLSEAILAPLFILDTPLNKVLQGYAHGHMKRQIKNPELQKKLTPDFHIGCKRVLISNDYYPALEKENVTVTTDAIECITEKGIRTRDGVEHEFDLIVFATGFHIEINQAPYDIRGLNGQALSEAWKRPGGKAYKGMSVAGFPNWFIMLGPNTGPGHTSVLVYTEAQAGYIVQGIDRLLKSGVKYLSVKRAVQEYYGTRLQKRMQYTTWNSGCASWYLDANGENHTLFPGLASEYVLSVRKFQDREYVQVR